MVDQSPDIQSVLQDRIRTRVLELNRSARDISLSSGLGADAIRTILSGKSKSPRGETLLALASELQCTTDYLLGATDVPIKNQTATRDQMGTLRGVFKLPITEELSLDWAPVDIKPDAGPDRILTVEELIQEEASNRGGTIFSLPDYLPGMQGLELISDDSADLIAPEGAVAHIRYAYAPSLELHDREYVVAYRVRKAADGEFENQRALWQVRRIGPSLFLQSLTRNPARQEEIDLSEFGDDATGLFNISVEKGATIGILGFLLRTTVRYSGTEFITNTGEG